MNVRVRKRSAGGRDAKLLARKEAARKHAPSFIERRIPVYEMLDEGSLQLIESNADALLQEIGVEFRDFPQALKLFRDAGADVTGELDGLVEPFLKDNEVAL